MTWDFLKRTLRSEGGFLHKKIGGFIGGAVRGAVGGVIGAVTRGAIPTPFTVIGGAVRGALGQREPKAMQVNRRFGRARQPLQTVSRLQGGGQRQTTGISVGPVLIGRRTETLQVGTGDGRGGQLPTQIQDGVCPPGAVCPKGMRPNKTSYFLRDGTFVPRESRCVRIRRRDALNGRAALNSTRRLVAYTKANRRVGNAIRAAARATRHK